MLKKSILFTLAWLLAIYAGLAWAQQTVAPGNKWEGEIQKFEEADRRHPPEKGAVLFIGSSSIRMWKDLATDFPKTQVINRGFGGSQIADSTYYVDRIIVPYQPRMIVLYAGDNDLAAGLTPQQVFEAYKAFVGRVREKLPRVKIAYISIKPSPARVSLLEKMRATNRMIWDYCTKHKNLSYIDVFRPMLGADGMPRPELFLPDKLHLNRAGYNIWQKEIAPYLH